VTAQPLVPSSHVAGEREPAPDRLAQVPIGDPEDDDGGLGYDEDDEDDEDEDGDDDGAGDDDDDEP
jgi:hypothetical protein